MSALILALLLQAAPQPAPQPKAPVRPAPIAADGKGLFREKCAMCHNATGMGTGLLARRIQPGELEKRTDLELDYIITAARTGIGNMPAITRGEVSDPQMKLIAGYLAKK